MAKININKEALLKWAGIACSGAGMIITALVTSKENNKAIEKAVKDYIDKK